MKKNLFKETKRKRNRKIIVLLVFGILFFQYSYSQTIEVSGVITDEHGEVLPGASVLIKGTSVGTITNFEGYYTIADVPPEAVLVFSYVGMLSQEIRVSSQTSFDVILQPDHIGMEEVVVVGYGTQRKSDVISSVTQVKADEMTKNVTLDVGEMLRGKAAGVYVTTENSGPGGTSTIQIRGKGSLGAATNPIIIADGVQIGSINDINPGDITSVEILKDASAQAIYGARASNGVILITTKRGESGQSHVDYSGYYGFQSVNRNFDLYSPEEYAQLKREAFRTTNKGEYGDDNLVFTPDELESLNNQEFIDWEEEVLRTGSIQNHVLSISSGTEKTQFYLSGNYQQHNGIVPTTDFTKKMLRFNLDHSVTKWLKVGLNTSLSTSTTNGPDVADVLNEVVRSSPLGQVYNEDGTIKVHPTGVQENWNPLNTLQEETRTRNNRNDLVNIFIDLSPFEGFNWRINGSRIGWDFSEEIYRTANSNSGYTNQYGGGEIGAHEQSSWTLENILSYTRSVENHNITATFVHSLNEINYNSFALEFPKVPNDILGVYGLESAFSWNPTISGYQRRLSSYAGRIQYDYASRYYLAISGRYDGSSVFGEENKWGFFPAVAVGWNIHRENFLSDFSSLTNLKIRASYGSVGNEAIEPYGSSGSADPWDYMNSAGKWSGYTPGDTLPNPGLKWETSTTLNMALDFGFFKNRLSGTFEFYKTNTTDLLVNRNIDASTGYAIMKDNVGEIENRGIELQLDGIFVRKKDFTLGAGIIFSANKNQILKLFGDLDGDGVEDDYPANNWFIGEPIDVYWDWVAIGIWQEDEVEDIPNSAQPRANPGSVKILDFNGDTLLDNEDREIVSHFPKWMGSFRLYGSYKGIDLSVDITTVQGIVRYNKYLAEYAYGGDLRGIFNGIKVDYWTPENPTGTFPRPTNASSPPNLGLLAKQNASFVKINNLTVGYTLPSKITSKINLYPVRFYCAIQNLYTFTEYSSYNPEQDPDDYPEARTISFGLQIGFNK